MKKTFLSLFPPSLYVIGHSKNLCLHVIRNIEHISREVNVLCTHLFPATQQSPRNPTQGLPRPASHPRSSGGPSAGLWVLSGIKRCLHVQRSALPGSSQALRRIAAWGAGLGSRAHCHFVTRRFCPRRWSSSVSHPGAEHQAAAHGQLHLGGHQLNEQL